MAALYGFAYTEKALAFLESLPQKLRRQVMGKIEGLASDPLPANHKLVRELSQQGENVYRIRSGDYRVLYVVRDITVVILDIDHRKDVYR